MNRRAFLQFSGGLGAAFFAPAVMGAQATSGYQNLLILVELKGGNDGLNTVIPYANRDYYGLRPKIAIKRDDVIQLDQHVGLHPDLRSLMPLWQNREMAVIQGLGYARPDLSHFRSIEIWDTASNSEQILQQGWLTRAFALCPPSAQSYGADGVVIGSQELGPFAGGARAIALANTEQFLGNSRLAMPANVDGNATLAHMLKVEADIVRAAEGLRPKQGKVEFKTEFPRNGFGDQIKTAAQVIALGEQTGKRVAVLRLSLSGFDTHQNQPGSHASLLKQLADGLLALKAALVEMQRWNSTLVATYAEFGRRPRENLSNGTDHGTAAPHFVMGGRVNGGLLGAAPDLARLDGSGNLAYSVDFRRLYATVLDQWWGVDPVKVLDGRFEPLNVIRA